MSIRLSTSALYYPHTTIRDPRLIKNALLLWDTVDCITPQRGFSTFRHQDQRHSAALELIVRDHIPSSDERRKADESIQRIVNSDLPSTFKVAVDEAAVRRREYGIHPGKLLHETWRKLEDQGYAIFDDNNVHDAHSGEYHVTPQLGLLMMAALADACAGSRLRRITDRGSAYAALTKYTAALAGAEYISDADASEIAPAYDRLVTLSLRTIDTDGIDIDRLIELRMREEKEGGRDLARLRENYLGHLDLYVDQLASVVVTQRDKLDLEREFQKSIEDDFKDLKSELGLARIAALFSKEVLTTALVAGGALVAAVSGVTDIAVLMSGIGSVVPLVGPAVKYTGVKRETLNSHTMSWLYVASRH